MSHDDDILKDLRARAESILERVEARALEISPSEVKALVQDLRVHQIELEIQNEELRLAQTELAKARDRYLNLYHQAPVGYLTLDPSGIIIQANNTFADLVGIGLADLAGRPFSVFVHPDDRDVFLGRFRAFFKDPSDKIVEVTLSRGENAWFNAKLEGRPMSSGEYRPGSFHEALLLVVSDVSEQRRAQEDLAASELRFRTLFEAGGDAILVTNLAGKIVEANQVVLARLGYPRQELIGLNISWLEPSPLADLFAMRTESLMEHGRITFETVHLTKDAREIPSELTCRVFELGGDRFVLNIARDISERVRLQDERDLLQGQLLQSQKMEAMGTLAGGIAHDFNNILAAVMGFAEIGLDLTARGASNREELRQILVAAERAKGLVKQILTFSRRMEVELRPLNLNLAVTSQMKLLRRTMPKNIFIAADLDADLSPVLANLNQLEQVVLNLANNARDAMPEGGRLTLRTEEVVLDRMPRGAPQEIPPGRFVMLTVGDNGVGMDETTMAHIFDPFFTTKEVGKGTGLGLSTVYGIVRGHGGFVLCESSPGEGTTFKVLLPAHQMAEAAEPMDVPESVEDLSGSETVLLIDDDEMVLEVAERILQGGGYTVLTARSGEEGWESFQKCKDEIALVISDLNMPGLGGLYFLRRMRETEPGVRVLASSGLPTYGKDEEMFAGISLSFVAKPYRRADLLRQVRVCLDTRD